MKALSETKIPVRALLLVVAASCAFLLMLPGVTIVTSYLNDLFIFLDGAHRIASGQVPNRDFHTALGPLSFYIPALGYWASGTMGGAMPFGMAFTTLFLALPVAHVLGTRLRPLIALPYGMFLLLVVAVPVNLGESVSDLSFAMFYNRIGWAALGVLLAMYLQPARRNAWQVTLDAACATALTLLMLYTKITYGVVALAILAFLLLVPRQRLWAALSFGLILVCGLVIEGFWQASLSHFEDLRLTSQVSGSRSFMDLMAALRQNVFEYAVLAIVANLVLWRTRTLLDLAFFGLCALPGLLIQSQNAQPWGILTVHAGVVVGTAMLLRIEGEHFPQALKTSPSSAAAVLLSAVLVIPTTVHCFIALSLHTAWGMAREGQALELPRFGEIRLISPWLSGKRTLMHTYIESIEDGARSLESLTIKPEKVSVLDFANPFSAGFALPPSNGDSAWLHWGRNVSATHFIPPKQLFADVQVLMVPKWGINPAPLLDLYGSFLEEAFEPLQETEGWIVLGRRSQDGATEASLSKASGPSSVLGRHLEPVSPQ